MSTIIIILIKEGTVEQLLMYWKQFSTVPINNNDEIEADFLHFVKGTSRFEIWCWFEDQHSDFKIHKVLAI